MICSFLIIGTLINAATWIRNFIRSHPMYKQDSVVSQETNFDLMIALDELWVALRFALYEQFYRSNLFCISFFFSLIGSVEQELLQNFFLRSTLGVKWIMDVFNSPY